MDLNRNAKTICSILGISALISFFFWASQKDYEEAVIYSMSQTAYEQIRSDLGCECTDKEIIDRYLLKKIYYDGLE